MKDLARGLLAPIFVFALLWGLGWFAVDQATSSAAILDQSVVTASSAPASPSDDPFAADASAPEEGQIQTYLDDISAGLFKWIVVVCMTGGICAILWFLWAQRMQTKVVGPAGQDKAFSAWVFALGVYACVSAAAYFYLIDPLGVDHTMDNSTFWFFVGLAGIAGAIAYWIATAIAASPVMKPSVPFAARKARP